MVRVVTDLVSVVISVALVAWGIWLLVTPDYDGGRHPAGVFMVSAGGVVGLWAAVAARRRLRQLRTRTPSRTRS